MTTATTPTTVSLVEIARKADAGETLTHGERVALIGAALNLCAECQTMFQEHFEKKGKWLHEYVRRALWERVSLWHHGSGCPPASKNP